MPLSTVRQRRHTRGSTGRRAMGARSERLLKASPRSGTTVRYPNKVSCPMTQLSFLRWAVSRVTSVWARWRTQAHPRNTRQVEVNIAILTGILEQQDVGLWAPQVE